MGHHGKLQTPLYALSGFHHFISSRSYIIQSIRHPPNTMFQPFQALRITLTSQQLFTPSSFIMSSPYPASWKCPSVFSLGDHLHPWRLNSNTTLSTKLVLTSWCACMLSCFSHVWLFVTPWTVAHQASLSMRFTSQNTSMGCHSLLQGIFPTQG